MKRAATNLATPAKLGASFASGPYLERLMAELDRAGIASRLKESRVQAGFTQTELGELFAEPIHWRSVQNYENVKLARVPWNRLDEWARITGVTKEWLIHGETVVPLSPAQVEERLDGIERRQGELVDAVAAIARTLDALVDRLERAQPGSGNRG